MLPTLNSSRWGTLSGDLFGDVRREFQRGLGLIGNASTVRTIYAPLSLWEDDEHVYVEMDVPGVCLEDVDLTFEDGRLIIRGERKFREAQQRSWYDERRYGPFERIVALSEAVDPESADACLHDGVLSITLTKKPEARAHRIKVHYEGSGAKRLSAES